MKLAYIIISATFVGAYIFFKLADKLIRRKEKKAGEEYCYQNGLIFIKAESYSLHTRLYFEKDGINTWVNYETDKNGIITWKKESPLEKIKRLKEDT